MPKPYEVKAYESLIKGFIEAKLDLQGTDIDDSVKETHPPHTRYERQRAGPTTFTLVGINLLEYVLEPILETRIVTRTGPQAVRIGDQAQQDLDNLLQQHLDKNQLDMQEKINAVQTLQRYFNEMAQERRHSPDPVGYDAFRDALRELLNFSHPTVYQNQEPLGTARVQMAFLQDLSSLYDSIERAKRDLEEDIDYLEKTIPSRTPNPEAFIQNFNKMKSALKKLEDGLRGAKRFGLFRPSGAMKVIGVSPQPLDLDIEAIAKALYYQQ